MAKKTDNRSTDRGEEPPPSATTKESVTWVENYVARVSRTYDARARRAKAESDK